jgi:outer membrane protein OmpA-like peptidoglycan-associated protein
MPSATALKAILGASLGLGVIDLAVIDVVLAPAVLESRHGTPVAETSGGSTQQLDTQGNAVKEVTQDNTVTQQVDTQVAAVKQVDTQATAVKQQGDPHVDSVKQRADTSAKATGTSAMTIETQRVYFATRSAALDDRVRATLDQLAARGGSFVLEGHADYRGGESENDKLSEQRAQAVADYLAARGIARARIDARHLGESAETAARQLWRDRRVDIQITREASP